MAKQQYYDDLETASPEAREERLMGALRGQLSNARRNSLHFSHLLAGFDLEAVRDRADLARLPVTRKSDMIDRQRQDPPFASMLAVPPGALARIFQSPGPIYDPEGRRADYWRFARAMYAAGFRKGDIVHNSFSYHLTPAGSMMETAAHALGCAVFPAGVGNTELQARAIADLQPAGYTGTPSFLKVLLDKTREMGIPSSIFKAFVTGEALPPSLRAAIADLNCTVYQCYGTADLGCVAYETSALEGMVVDERTIVEIVRPGTGDPVAEGEVGEVVVTVLTPEYPLIRFATGDLSAILPGISPCGRTNMRIKGRMGRADQTTKVKGMFVHPQQIADVVRRYPEIARARLVVERERDLDVMTLHCEVASPAEGLAAALAETMQAVLKLKGGVQMVAPGSLANDGKVIDDQRPAT